MNGVVKIYALINPIDNNVFYVGATRKKLKERLYGHLTDAKRYGENEDKTIAGRRASYVNLILWFGKKPIIKLLFECQFEETDIHESRFYEQMVAKGNMLMQDSNRFSYCTTEKRDTIFTRHENLSW